MNVGFVHMLINLFAMCDFLHSSKPFMVLGRVCLKCQCVFCTNEDTSVMALWNFLCIFIHVVNSESKTCLKRSGSTSPKLYFSM